MAEKALQVNFKYNVPAEALMAGTAKSAEEIASKPGLRWKIWIYNDHCVFSYVISIGVKCLLGHCNVAIYTGRSWISNFFIRYYYLRSSSSSSCLRPI